MYKKKTLLKKPSLLNIPIFIVVPFVAFLLTFKNLKSNINAIIFILFCTLFGYAFTFNNTSADSYRVALTFTEFDYTSLWDIVPLYILGAITDIYRFLLYAFVKGFSNNPKILFACFGFVFGVFWYLSLRVFINEKRNINDIYSFILFFIFIIFNSITSINGARFNTAIWVFFYATINIVLYKKKRFFILLLITPLIHYALLLPLFIVIVFFTVKKFLYSNHNINKLLYFLFVFTFCASWVLDTNIINLDFLGDIIPSDGISNKIGRYNSDELTNLYEERASTSLFLKVSNFFLILIKIFFFFFIRYAYYKLKKINFPNIELNRLLTFVIFYMSLAFIASSFPSGIRYLMIGYLFCILFMLKYYISYSDKAVRKFIIVLLPIFSFKFFFNVVFLSITLTSSTIWYGNLFWIIYEGMGYKFIYL